MRINKFSYLDVSIPVVSAHKDIPSHISFLEASCRASFQVGITTAVQMIPVSCKLDTPRQDPEYHDLEMSQSLETKRQLHQSKLS